MAEKEKKRTEGLPQPPPEIVVAETKAQVRLEKGHVYSYRTGSFPVDLLYAVSGRMLLTREASILPCLRQGKGAIALFLLAGYMVGI